MYDSPGNFEKTGGVVVFGFLGVDSAETEGRPVSKDATEPT
jgi:hypothetical protein